MTHARKTIRDKFVELLEAASIVAAGKVYNSRTIEILGENLPALNVRQNDEPEISRAAEVCSGQLERTFVVLVEVAAAELDNEDIADTLDAKAEAVEGVFRERVQLDLEDLVTSCELASTSPPLLATAADRTVGKLLLGYRVTYFS